MKRVYTDPRFPGFEVHNDGDNLFRVYEITGGQQHEIDTFRTYAAPNGLPEEIAAQRARDYFDRMHRAYSGEGHHQMSAELDSRQDADPNAVPIKHHQPAAPGEPFGLSASKSLDQIMGDEVLTADDVIAAFEQVQQMPEGPDKLKAMERVKSMSSQLEGSADELVRRLID